MTRSQDRYDAFAKAVDVPMLVITLLWLPVLIVPLVVRLHGSMAETFATIDYTVWALFALEYVIKLSLAPRRGHFVKTHLLDLLIVAVPFFRPLRMGRLVRLLRLPRVAVVVGEALRRGKSIFTHNGFHFVVLAAATIVFAVRDSSHSQSAVRRAPTFTTSGKACGGPLRRSPPLDTATSIRPLRLARAWPFS